MLKRLIDLSAAALGLALFAPVLAAVAVCIKIDSRGPVLYRQRRVGRHGNEFDILKFRTMHTLVPGPAVTVQGDPRITSVGRRLRSTKLDELPQLVNVLVGDMSLIGPRPEVPEYVALWPPADRAVILSVRPGLSDPASIAFRWEAELLAKAEDPERFYREVILPQKVALYVDYATAASTRRDIGLMLGTARAVLRGNGRA